MDVTTALILLFTILGLPFGVWMMIAALTYDNQTDHWRDV